MTTKYAINCSLLFQELPLLERPAAAKDAGFDAVEFWWPFERAVPTDREADAFVAAVRDAGVQLIGLNFFAGTMPAGDRGMVSWTGRETEFAQNVEAVVEIGRRTGCTSFNALYGNRLDGVSPQAQDDLAAENLTRAADAVAAIGGTVLVEPVSGADRYPIRTAADVFDVLARVPRGNVGFLCDLYHLAVNGDDLDAVIDTYGTRVAHVQIADAPGRHQPGTGELDLPRYVDRLTSNGYTGWVALEYVPTSESVDSFGWLREAARQR